MPNNTHLNIRTDENEGIPAPMLQKWGGLASILLAVALISASLIYLMGDLRAAMGPFSYSLADFLAGPVWGASLVTMVLALRERIGDRAPRRMSLALLVAVLAAAAMIAVACIRASNRHYHLIHPELHLENDSTVLIVWATLVAGVTATGWHLLGWALVLVGSAGWTSARLPHLLSALYLVAGVNAIVVFLFPNTEGNAAALTILISIWQGILLLRGESRESRTSEINAGQLDQA